MPFLEVRRLAYSYPDGTPALRGVSFDVEAGEVVGLVGPNGAGKSTLLWHLNGLLPEESRSRGNAGRNGAARLSQRSDGAGEGGRAHDGLHEATVRLGGLRVEHQHLPQIRRAVGLLFQDPDDQLFCPTVRDDVAFGPLHLGLPADEVERRVDTALGAVELGHLGERLPHHLSLGERRRVCLAGVLACRPQLLALDEPTANLDPRGRRHLLKILAGLDCAMLIASHDLEMILELCARVILLDHGEIHAAGPTREILANAPLLEAHGLEVPPSIRHGHAG